MERDRFKSRIAPRLRGAAANRFLGVIRDPKCAGLSADDVVRLVFWKVTQYMNNYQSVMDTQVHVAICKHFQEAVCYAAYLAEFDAKPKAQMRRAKRHRETMRNRRPSSNQVAFLRTLGASPKVNSRLSAHDAIDAALLHRAEESRDRAVSAFSDARASGKRAR